MTTQTRNNAIATFRKQQTSFEKSLKKEIKLTHPGRIGKVTFILKGCEGVKDDANRMKKELKAQSPDKLQKVIKRKQGEHRTYGIYESFL